MTMTDPIADMLTRIRNALRIEKQSVDIPRSRIKIGIAEALKREGYIRDFKVSDENKGTITVFLKYGRDGEHVITTIERVSKPGRRVYAGCDEIKPVLNGLGVAILSTNKGIRSDRECRAERLGGEVLCKLW